VHLLDGLCCRCGNAYKGISTSKIRFGLALVASEETADATRLARLDLLTRMQVWGHPHRHADPALTLSQTLTPCLEQLERTAPAQGLTNSPHQ
jgi:hypothetical protein